MEESAWWNTMFVEGGEVYAEVLEARRSEAESEAEFVASRLEERGVGPGALVLDLACGIGRHAVELADLGYRVTGVDLSPTLLKRGERLADDAGVAGQVNFVEGDMRAVDELFADGQFDAVVNLFSSFGFFDDATNGEVLARCRRLCTDESAFIIDTMNRDWLMRNFQPTGLMVDGEVMTIERRDFDFARSRAESKWTMLCPGEGDTLVKALETEIDIRVYTLRELIELFEENGWAFTEAFGDLSGAEFEVGSRRIVGVFEQN